MVALRGDLRDVVEFDFFHGTRMGALRALEWDHVDTDALVMKVRRKTTEPGVHYQEIPLTEDSAAIIGRQRGKHPRFVFTYEVKRAHRCGKEWIRKGERRPLTKTVMRQVRRAARKIGMDDFRNHDMRHTAINRILRESQNMEVARQAAGHSDIATTAIYTGVLIEDVRNALRKTRRNPHKIPTIDPVRGAQSVEDTEENNAGIQRPERGALPG